MPDQEGEEQHDGLLIRGADGRLFFMRDDANEPVEVKLEEDIAEDINSQLDEAGHGEFTGLPPGVQDVLRDKLHLKVTSGIVFFRTTRPPR